MNSLKTTIDILPALNEGTQVYKFLSSLTENTSIKELLAFSVCPETETEVLREKENELHSLNKNLLTTEIAIINKQITELNDLISRAVSHKATLTHEVKDALILRLQEIEKLKENEAKGIQYIAERRGIEFYASPEFTAFLHAAENYVKLLIKDYPKQGDLCIYCRQPLREEDSIVLLTEYKNLLRDTTQAQLKSLNSQIDALLLPIQQLNDDFSIRHSSFGEDANGSSIQPDILRDYSYKIAALRKTLLSKDLSAITSLDFSLEIDFVTSMLTTRLEEVRALKTAKSTVLQELETRESQIRKCIAELKDRLTLHKHENTVKTVINNIKLHSLLSKLSTSFNTNALSRKTTAARSALIESNFREIFDKELRYFKRSNFEIDVSFQTDKGASIISQVIRDKHSLSDILSEGEQKAIALAEFLTELRLEDCNAPVIFDDPVTSLDHHIIDQIARRLIELSKERQVVIFTHSIIFFNSIKQKSEITTYKELDFKFYETTKDTNVTGILIESPNIREDNFNHYKGIINTILRTPLEKRERSEVAMAIEGYNNLRAAIEVLVEHDLLQSTIKRYRKNIALTSLEKINGKLIDQYKAELSEIFERCCSYTDAHSSTEELIRNPNLEELKIDFDKVQEIRSYFVK
jgi:ABC-type histidine transport system ATPase subunit